MSMTEFLHPGLLLIAAALPVLWLGGWVRSLWVIAMPLAALCLIWQWPQGHYLHLQYVDYELSLLVIDHLSRIFALVFALFTAVAMLFCCRQANRHELAAALLCSGSALGIVLAGDLITLFVFWELLALGGSLLIRANHTPAARGVGRRYLYLHLCGCAVLLAGIAGHTGTTGSISFTDMAPDTAAHYLMLAGFLLTAAAVPLAFWLPAACSRATFNGAVVLSGLVTQTALYTLLRGFPGTELLIVLGLIMIVYGIVYAVLADALRRLLAYSLVSQVGFVLVATGIGTESALNAAVAMGVMLTLIMGLMFMTAAAVADGTGRQRLSELGGLYQSMPLTTGCAIIGAVSLLAVPLTGGHASRVLLDEAVRAGTFTTLGWFLYAGTAGAVLHAGFRYPWFTFYHRDSGLRPSDPPWNMRLAMLLLAWLCILIGMAPCQLYAHLPYAVACEPYDPAVILAALQRAGFAILGFFMLLRWLEPRRRVLLDVDWLIQRLVPMLRPPLSWLAACFTACFAREAVREAALIAGLLLLLLLCLYWF
jgi:multicomponent Na+:H+ antiporter subunit D